jgi:hypothetical protein
MLRENLLPSSSNDPRWAETWQELGHGAPTLAGLARVCSMSLASGVDHQAALSTEAKAILFAARERGVVEIKGSNQAFDAPGRMLAVYVEATPERTFVFRRRDLPAYTIRFLAGFRELCAAGLVMHHIYQEFSLTREGLEMAQTIREAEVAPLIEMATDLDVHV